MPPKKKKSGKKGKKSAKKSGRGSPSKSMSDQLNELSKEYYIIQIRDLENRLARYQKKCDELEVRNSQFQGKFDQMSKDIKDNEKFYKREIQLKDNEIYDLNDRLHGLQQAREMEKEQANAQLQQLRADFQETKDRLSSENMALGGRLASVEEFEVQKVELERQFEEMKQALAQKDVDHEKIIYDLEKKAVMDKDRLKKEMIARVNEVAGEFRKVSNKQMAETTKRTIRENVSLATQIKKTSDKNMEIIQENDKYKEELKKQKQQIEMLEATEKEMAKKNYSNQKLIRMLTEKCRNQEAMIGEYELREGEYQELEAELDLLRQTTEAQRDEMQQLAREKEQYEDSLQETQDSLVAQRKQKDKLDRVLAESANALKIALRKTGPDDLLEDGDDLNEIERRDFMLENLLILLNSAAVTGVGPHPAELGKQFRVRQRSAGEMPGSKKGIQKGEMPMSPIARSKDGTLPHYQLGDLGLIPRPKQQIPTSLDKMRALSATTRLGGLRKVLTRSIGIQTVSAPKALFYADQLLNKAPSGTQEAVLHKLPTDRIVSPAMPLGPINAKRTSKVF
ncbi:hypothetical protein KUTeg_021647 [Tegillarca granosa]|uniref:Cilia- and flagella-associated protein 157 n=1 Tax=Tegillarca granosa TaxID=220873 RepID=A0ABQ9E3X9_TEGGR|nr:hypothetical protein KUTeg_021647 [Tegillarca granosa]